MDRGATRPKLLYLRRDRQHILFAELPADNLQPDRHPARVQPAGTDATGSPVRLSTNVGAIQSM